MLSPSLALSLHASNSIAALQGLASERPALAQLRALSYAVRWDIGIDQQEFLGSVLEGERWLVHASGAVRLHSKCVFPGALAVFKHGCASGKTLIDSDTYSSSLHDMCSRQKNHQLHCYLDMLLISARGRTPEEEPRYGISSPPIDWRNLEL